MADVALDLEDVFLFFLDDIGVCIYCKQVMAKTLFPAPTMRKISLVVLVLFARLVQKDRRLWVLATRYISGRSVGGLSPSLPSLQAFTLKNTLNRSCGSRKVVAAMSLPLHQQLFQRLPSTSLVSGLRYLTAPGWKVLDLSGSIGLKFPCLNL